MEVTHSVGRKGWEKSDPHETDLSLAWRSDPSSPVPGPADEQLPKGVCPRIPRFVCCRGPPLPLGTASAIISKTHFLGMHGPPTRRSSRLLDAATPRPRFPGKQTISCLRVFAEDPALRLLSGSIPSTRHGVRSNFKNSLFGDADPHETNLWLVRRSDPSSPVPGQAEGPLPNGVSRGSRVSFAVGVYNFYSARRPE
jgi:hypothetical protein